MIDADEERLDEAAVEDDDGEVRERPANISSKERFDGEGGDAAAEAEPALRNWRPRFRLAFSGAVLLCSSASVCGFSTIGGGGGESNPASVDETKVSDWTEQMEMASLFSSFRSL